MDKKTYLNHDFEGLLDLQDKQFLQIEALKKVSKAESKYQGSTAEKTTLQKPNQGVCTDVAYYHPCLNFFGYFLFSRKESDKTCLKKIIT